MNSPAPIPLRDRLLAAANAWAQATGRSLGALSARVMNDGKTLDRLADPSRTVTDATLTRFATFLLDPVNWPDAKVADEAKALAHVTGVTPDMLAASAGKPGDASSEREKAA